MNKKELVDLLHLNINRAKVSPDMPASKRNIGLLLPAAISEAIMVYTREENREAYNSFRIFGDRGEGVVQPFLTTYEYTPVMNDSRGLYSITLASGVQAVPGDAGLSDIFSKNGDSIYRKVRSPKNLSGLDMVGTTFFWYEKQSGGETKVFFKNLGLPVCALLVRMIVSVADLSDSDELPIPDGYLMRVIDRVQEYYFRQFGIPLDNIANDKQDHES